MKLSTVSRGVLKVFTSAAHDAVDGEKEIDGGADLESLLYSLDELSTRFVVDSVSGQRRGSAA